MDMLLKQWHLMSKTVDLYMRFLTLAPFFRILWKSVPWNEQISHCMEDRSATQIILIFIFIVSTLCLEIYFLNGSVTFSNWNNDEKV